MVLKWIVDTDEAVSSVISVVLMVAVTVILAAVVATFALGVGDQVNNNAPQASFDFDYEADSDVGPSPKNIKPNDDFGEDADTLPGGGGNLTVSHAGGDGIEAQNLYITGYRGMTKRWSEATTYSDTDTIAAGDDLFLYITDDVEIEIVWRSQGETDSVTLATWEAPEA